MYRHPYFLNAESLYTVYVVRPISFIHSSIIAMVKFFEIWDWGGGGLTVVSSNFTIGILTTKSMVALAVGEPSRAILPSQFRGGRAQKQAAEEGDKLGTEGEKGRPLHQRHRRAKAGKSCAGGEHLSHPPLYARLLPGNLTICHCCDMVINDL